MRRYCSPLHFAWGHRAEGTLNGVVPAQVYLDVELDVLQSYACDAPPAQSLGPTK